MEIRYAEEGSGPGIFRTELGDQRQPISQSQRWCCLQRGCVILGALGLLAGAGVASWLLGQCWALLSEEERRTGSGGSLENFQTVLYLWPAASPSISGTLQEEEMTLTCPGVSSEEELLPSLPKTVSFRINAEDLLLQVQVRARPDWLLVCHEGWNPALGMRICQSLGHIRLTQHKAVNLSDIKLNRSQEFAQLSARPEGLEEEAWQPSFRLSRLSSWRVHAGLVSHGAVRQHQGTMVEKIIPHPLYSAQNHDYDVALLQLRTPINFSDTVGAVCLPAKGQHFPRGYQCWVSGWGHTDPSHTHSSDTLQDTMVPLLSTHLCNSSCMYSGALTHRMLCAGYLDGRADACQGDSGGPLVCPSGDTWHLVGVVSWGRGCGEPNHPGVYAKVAEFLDWIHDTVRVSVGQESSPSFKRPTPGYWEPYESWKWG
ncbi:transmembrane protease serine 5 isoform X5 [Mastomys coucha]|uniref:transmembrane protease serine 5 isoform X5 n=1 Tax=Mastomys coucha TaxID=35658 RepID=UPI00126169A6|nr:transmembrane protease serine 5 isoform X5 [Mastomys coucha]